VSPSAGRSAGQPVVPSADRFAVPSADRSRAPPVDRSGDHALAPAGRSAGPYVGRSAGPLADRSAGPYVGRSASPLADRRAAPSGDRCGGYVNTGGSRSPGQPEGRPRDHRQDLARRPDPAPSPSRGSGPRRDRRRTRAAWAGRVPADLRLSCFPSSSGQGETPRSPAERNHYIMRHRPKEPLPGRVICRGGSPEVPHRPSPF